MPKRSMRNRTNKRGGGMFDWFWKPKTPSGSDAATAAAATVPPADAQKKDVVDAQGNPIQPGQGQVQQPAVDAQGNPIPQQGQVAQAAGRRKKRRTKRRKSSRRKH